jgi:hypothetical protein
MKNRLILCVGFRGSDKSTVASSILRENDGALIFDPHGDDAYKGAVPNTARSIDELEDYCRWRRESKPGTRAAIRYIPDGRIDPFEALNDFCAWVWTWRNVWLCGDEVSECCRSVSSMGMPPELRRIVNQGRHRGINQVYCGLRYAEFRVRLVWAQMCKSCSLAASLWTWTRCARGSAWRQRRRCRGLGGMRPWFSSRIGLGRSSGAAILESRN